MVTYYRIKDIDNFEDFLNKLFNGLKHYESKNKHFSFRIKYSKDVIELTTIKLNEFND
jgi:hypothetical protein